MLLQCVGTTYVHWVATIPSKGRIPMRSTKGVIPGRGVTNIIFYQLSLRFNDKRTLLRFFWDKPYDIQTYFTHFILYVRCEWTVTHVRVMIKRRGDYDVHVLMMS